MTVTDLDERSAESGRRRRPRMPKLPRMDAADGVRIGVAIVAIIPATWAILDLPLIGDYALLANNDNATVAANVNTVLNLFTLMLAVVGAAVLLLDVFDRYTKWEFQSRYWALSVAGLIVVSRFCVWLLGTNTVAEYTAVRNGIWHNASDNSWLILAVLGIGGVFGILRIMFQAKFKAGEWSARDVRGMVFYGVMFGALLVWLYKDGQYTFLMEEGGRNAFAKTFRVAVYPISLAVLALFAAYPSRVAPDRE